MLSMAWPSRTNRPLQVVLPGLLDLAALDVHEVEHQLLPRDQRPEVVAE